MSVSSSSRARFLVERLIPFNSFGRLGCTLISIGPDVEFGRVDGCVDGSVDGPERGLDEAGSPPLLDLELDLVFDGIMVSKD